MGYSFMFWNTQKKAIQSSVAKLAREHGSSIVILSESGITPADMTAAFTAEGLDGFQYASTPAGTDGDINVYVKFEPEKLQWVYDDFNNHIAARRLVDKTVDILLVMVHFQSKREWNDDDQVQGAGRLSTRIVEWEKRFPYSRTVLVGDLNMNPFEKGVVGSECLHAVMTKEIASQGGRIVDAEHRPFFYNPMWRFFGERPGTPPGTYYYERSGRPICYYWNVFDQVLVRPSLALQLENVRVGTSVEGDSLLSETGRIESDIGSDHLPLLFDLNI